MSASRQRLSLEIADMAARHFRVRHRISGIDSASVELFLPIWTPGSYTVRDYASYVVDVAVSGPGTPRLKKLESNRWIVTGCEGEIELVYRIFAPERSTVIPRVDGPRCRACPASSARGRSGCRGERCC